MKPDHLDFSVTLDRPRIIRANAASLARFAELYGQSFWDVDLSSRASFESTIRALVFLLFAMAEEVDPKADPTLIARAVTPARLPYFLEVLRNARCQFLPGSN